MTFPIYTFATIYAITILVGILTYSKYSHRKELKLFLFFLIYSFFTEIIGAYLGRVLFITNNFIYNTWNIVNFLFFAFFILSRINTKKKRTFIKILIGLFISLTIINIVFYANFINQFLIYNALLAKFLTVISIIVYFTELLDSDDILNIKNSLYFWICLGVFLYNLAFLPAFALAKYTSFFGSFKYITFGLNIIMNLCFITGFILSKKEYN
jgi:hypothetical protein